MHFSVIIPLYNGRSHIARTLRSVLGQSHADFELIVVDDGSDDGSAEIVDAFDDSRIRLVRQRNSGASAACNKGLELARHEWLAFLNADDLWLSNHLEELQRVITRCPKAGMVANDTAQLTTQSPLPRLDTRQRAPMYIDYFMSASKRIGIIHRSAVCLSRYLLDAVGGFRNHRYGADLEMWARAALHSPVALSSKVTVVYYTQTGVAIDSMQSTQSQQNAKQYAYTLDAISPSVSALAAFLQTHPDSPLNDGIRAYINSRIDNSIKSRLFHLELASARHEARLYLRPLGAKNLALRAGVLIPAALLRPALRAYLRK